MVKGQTSGITQMVECWALYTHSFQKLFFLHLLTEPFRKDFSTLIRISCSCFRNLSCQEPLCIKWWSRCMKMYLYNHNPVKLLMKMEEGTGFHLGRLNLSITYTEMVKMRHYNIKVVYYTVILSINWLKSSPLGFWDNLNHIIIFPTPIFICCMQSGW